MKSILKYELYKIIKTKFFLGILFFTIIILSGVFFVNFHYSQLSLTEKHNQDKNQYEIYKKNYSKYEGIFNQQKVNTILIDFMYEYQKYKVEDRPMNLFSWNIAETFFENEQDVYTKMNEANSNNKTVKLEDVKVKSLKSLHFVSFKHPLTIGNYVGWNDYIQVISYVCLLSMFISILISSITFADDESKNISPLLLSTKFGRSKLTYSKILSAYILSITFFLVLQNISLISFYIYNDGFNGWNNSIQTNFLLKIFDFSLNINQLQSVILILIFQLFVVIFVVSIALLISSKAKTPFFALTISLIFLFTPLGLTKIFREGFINNILFLFPINNYKGQDILSILNGNFLLPTFMYNYIFLLIFMILSSLTMLIYLYRVRKYKSF